MEICPFCGQDYICPAHLMSKPSVTFSICMKCDSLWVDGPPGSNGSVTNFVDHMRNLGIEPDWSDIFRILPPSKD